MRDEHLGRRDLTFSRRHRQWYGRNVPFTDLDCLRYDRATPVALEEWKYGPKVSRRDVERMLVNNPNIAASRRLADAAELPYFITRHSGEAASRAGSWQFDVIPGNERARLFVAEASTMSEAGYVEFIHRLGGHEPDRGFRRWLERCGD